jgi:hypothetical protein
MRKDHATVGWFMVITKRPSLVKALVPSESRLMEAVMVVA